MTVSFAIEETADLDLVRRIVTAPEIYGMASDDGSPDPEDFRPEPGFLYLAVDGGELGCFAFHAHNSTTVEVHTCLLKKAWGDAPEIAKAARQWVWDNTP